MSAHRFGVQSRRPRGLPSVHSRGPQKKTAAQRPPSLHSWVIAIAHIRFQGSGPSVPSQPAHASSPLCLHASDDPSSQAARRIVAPIGCRAKWRRTRSCTARLHDGASWPGVSCRMLPPESSGSRPALFRASRRRYSTSVRGIASCDSVATCMRHYVASPS